jgi:hypothetical protein
VLLAWWACAGGVIDSVFVEFDPQQVVEGVRELLRRRLGSRGYREFDRQLGRADSGWTTKFLRGKRELTSLELLLKILQILQVHPGDFFAEIFPRPEEQRVAVEEYFDALRTSLRDVVEEVVDEKLKESRRE